MKKEVDELEDELRPEYDFSKMAGGVRGKYVERYRAGTNFWSAQSMPMSATSGELESASMDKELARFLLTPRERGLNQ